METGRIVRQFLGTSGAALAGARDLLRAERRRALAEALPHAEDAYRLLAGNEDLARAVANFKPASRDTAEVMREREIGED
jgi:hypothetical protein